MKRLSVSIFLLLAFTFAVLVPSLHAEEVVPDAMNTYNVTTVVQCSGGTVSPLGTQSATENEPFEITITPRDRMVVGSVIIKSSNTPMYVLDTLDPEPYTWEPNGAGSYKFTIPAVTENVTVTICFVDEGARMFEINASVDGGGGTISDAGVTTHAEFSNASYTITPNAGGAIAEVLVDNINVLTAPLATDQPYTYEFTNITANHTIVAKFVQRTLTVEFHYAGEGVDDATFTGKGTVASAIMMMIGTLDTRTGVTWRGFSTTATQGFTANLSLMLPGFMGMGSQELWLDSIVVDNVKYTGTITNQYMVGLNPALPITVNDDVVLKMYMSVGLYAGINLSFVYADDKKPARAGITPGLPFENATIDGATAKALAAAPFHLNYYLQDLTVPANSTPDYKVDSILVNGIKWTDPIPATALGISTVENIIPTVYSPYGRHYYTIIMHLTEDPLSGIIEVDIPSLSLNPNPVESKAIITKDASVNFTKIDIIDILGNVVMVINNPSDELDVAGLGRGSYIVRFYTKDGFAARSIIKQ